MGALQGIQHVVVLMLENRSFDCMLGGLYPSDGTFEGVKDQTNVFAGRPLPVWAADAMGPFTACIPDPDPGEMFTDMNQQLFGGNGTPVLTPPPMSGFVQNYMAQQDPPKPPDPMAVMHYFTPDQVPVMSALAKAFGVCDQWHASAPCQTWPNRFFVHTATCGGHVNNHNFPIPFGKPSIFRRLSEHNRTWRVYFHDMPQSILLGDIWLQAPLHYRRIDQFIVDAHNGVLPNYSFIEPRYFANRFDGNLPNDQHPPHDVTYGEQLMAQVYNAVRSSPCWKQTLLVITYDEHGGCYDHVPPPLAVPPDTDSDGEFAFDRYGVRVPALLISPYIARGSKVRVAPTGLPHNGPPYPFDHTSIIKTLRLLFDLGDPLTRRDAVAPDLLGPLSLAAPTNDGPPSVAADGKVASPDAVQQRSAAVPNGMQITLSQAAQRLPPAPLTPQAGVAPQAGAAPQPAPLPPPTHLTVIGAATDAIERVNAFLGISPDLGSA